MQCFTISSRHWRRNHQIFKQTEGRVIISHFEKSHISTTERGKLSTSTIINITTNINQIFKQTEGKVIISHFEKSHIFTTERGLWRNKYDNQDIVTMIMTKKRMQDAVLITMSSRHWRRIHQIFKQTEGRVNLSFWEITHLHNWTW